MSNISILENSKIFKTCITIVALVHCLTTISCNRVPKPCDPVFVSAQQNALAVSCRADAVHKCPGFDSMSDEEKLACPGVTECLDKINKMETDCNGK